MKKPNNQNQSRRKGNLFSAWVGEGANKSYSPQERSKASGAFLGLVILAILLTSGTRLYNYEHYTHANNSFLSDGFGYQLSMFLMYGAFSLAAAGCAYVVSQKRRKKMMFGATLAAMGISALTVVALFFGLDFMTLAFYTHQSHLGVGALCNMLKGYFGEYGVLYAIPAFLAMISFGIKGFYLNRQDQTSGEHGTAAYADKYNLKEIGAYAQSDDQGVLFGKDASGKFLRYPICNRTIISYTGGGKTAGVVIPTLLTQKRPMFIYDCKGELWAVTARHRCEVFGHEIAMLDPYSITKTPEFIANKPAYLTTKVYRLNPLDAIPKDIKERDAAISALVKSLMVRDAKSQKGDHFLGIAETLLMGLIEWVLATRENPTLIMVHDILDGSKASIKSLLAEMRDSTTLLRARSAGARVLSAAKEELGSILTTTGQQLSWLSDVNLRDLVSETTFDLKDLIRGKMDVYVCMPDSDPQEKGRVFRMILSCVRNLLVQSPRAEVSKEAILFLFDELGQLGPCEDVVNMLPIMRAYNAKFWAVFQDISQIQAYGDKGNLFMSARLMQFFGIGDDETIRWICRLGGRKTYITSSNSESKGQSGSKSGGQSQNESVSVQESGADLIKYNEVREMPVHKQIVFIQGVRPIDCEKVYYLSDPLFKGRYDRNPLEG